MLMRFDSFRQLDWLSQMLARQAGSTGMATIPMDAYRENDRFVVRLDLPGVDPESIDLTVERNVLTVRAERRWEPTEDQEVVVVERPQGTFTRQLFLGESLEAEHVEAAYVNGTLTLTIPVAEQSKPRKVEIAAGAGEGRAIPAESTRTTPPAEEAKARTSAV